ncbi:FkbM family methyltransferase [Pedobacter changchengzhani]|uniref:FkbM family methyltransferase n=1 Tax=Pedobacter changchengzhani TaxID=2529274 RepID=A0A4R5MI74_9SPHI|nr:FkbM family methyltransferase [Pedobacter changchengzhani]TDG35287.1 FkbM family methyltransferase [Pedobacter changchengzhani]
MQSIYQFILRRAFFSGQDRIFNYLFTHNKFKKHSTIVQPLTGDFEICCDTATWIGGKIVYTGDYEPELKKVFKSIIKKGDQILDVGANIGFHTLYFAQLTGENGSVKSFEPVPQNFKALNNNIGLNSFLNITTYNIALSNQKEQIIIDVDAKSTNPGAFNLFEQGRQTPINCFVGDEIIGGKKVDFIKVDVEGYESFVIEGLMQTINKNKPKIIFEYDKHYHEKTGRSEDYILLMLAKSGYRFQYVTRKGLVDVKNFQNLLSGNILAKYYE